MKAETMRDYINNLDTNTTPDEMDKLEALLQPYHCSMEYFAGENWIVRFDRPGNLGSPGEVQFLSTPESDNIIKTLAYGGVNV